MPQAGQPLLRNNHRHALLKVPNAQSLYALAEGFNLFILRLDRRINILHSAFYEASPPLSPPRLDRCTHQAII